MNINIVREYINSLKKIKIKLKIYLGRNKYEYYEGYIYKIYANLFTVTTNKGIKTISFSDIASKQVSITKFN